jgi:hypothetical protein
MAAITKNALLQSHRAAAPQLSLRSTVQLDQTKFSTANSTVLSSSILRQDLASTPGSLSSTSSLLSTSLGLPNLRLPTSALDKPCHHDTKANDTIVGDGVFAGRIYAIHGLSSTVTTQLKRAIVAQGGAVSFGVSEHVDGVLVSKAPEPTDRLPFKLKQALRLNVPLLLASYVQDCLDSLALRDPTPYTCRNVE